MRSALSFDQVTDTIVAISVSGEQFLETTLSLLINGMEIDIDLFGILEHIGGNGKEWLPWVSDDSGEDEEDLSTLGGREETFLQDDGKSEGPFA